MASNQFNAGITHGNTQAKTEELVDSAKSTASKAHDKACEATGKSHEQAQRSKEENAGFLQQTGEQMATMAQGAIDGVTNALGLGENKPKK